MDSNDLKLLEQEAHALLQQSIKVYEMANKYYSSHSDKSTTFDIIWETTKSVEHCKMTFNIVSECVEELTNKSTR